MFRHPKAEFQDVTEPANVGVVNGFRSLTGILLVPARMFRVDILAGPVHKKVRMY